MTRLRHPPNLAKLQRADDVVLGSIYLIRHGQASFGADNYDVLSPLGVRQAQVLGAHLAQLDIRLDRCVAGDLLRQQDTARHALAQFSTDTNAPEIETDAAFNEFDADAVIRALLPAMLDEEPRALDIMRNAAQNRSEFQRIFAKVITRWLGGEHDVPGLETWQGFLARVDAGLQRLLDQAETQPQTRIGVFTSGGTITALLHLITRIPATQAFELNWQIVNTSLSTLKFRGREVALASFNSHTHLQLLKAPELISYR